MDREERLYRPENPNVDRSAKSIGILLGNKTHIDILSRDKDHPQSNHPLRAQARRVMQSLRPTETTNAAKLLLSGIGQAEYIKQVRAAQFLFSELDFMKMEPNSLRDAFTAAITDQTPIDNVKAVIDTGELIIPQLPNFKRRNEVQGAIKSIHKDLRNSPHYEEIKKTKRIERPRIPMSKNLFDVTKLSEKDRRIIDAHHQGIPHSEIAKKEGLSTASISTQLTRLRIKGVYVERRTHAGSESEIKNRREIVRDCTLQGMKIEQIMRELKKHTVKTSYHQIREDRSILRRIGELPPYGANNKNY